MAYQSFESGYNILAGIQASCSHQPLSYEIGYGTRTCCKDCGAILQYDPTAPLE